MDFIKSIISEESKYAPIVINDAVVRSAITIMFNPFFWNFVGRVEFSTHILTKITGCKRYACYLFAVVVFTLGIFRDYLYYAALKTQPTAPILDNSIVRLLGWGVAGFGHVLVLSSMYALGVTGTYLGDYFGILMDHKLESFPFSFCNNPMYVGSTLSFLGVALHEGKAVGIALSLLVWIIYRIGLVFEEPFTDFIYSNRKDKKTE